MIRKPAFPGTGVSRALNIAGLNLSLLCLGGVAVADVPDAAPFRIVRTDNLGAITGEASVSGTASRWDVHGADLGHMFWHKDKLYMVFGDTFGAFDSDERNWRSNTMARIGDPDPHKGLQIEDMIIGEDGFAKELIGSRKVGGVEKTVIPTHGVSTGSRMFLHYMSVQSWGTHGDWVVGHSGIAYSDDDGQNWTKPPEAVWPRGSGFEQVAFVRKGAVLYTFGIPEGRFGGVRLRRVDVDRILQPEAYRFWDGADWVADADAAAVVVPGPVGELSVAWSTVHRRWLMMYLNPEARAVVIRSAGQLTGPWTAEQVLTTAEEFPGLCAPYFVPGSNIDGELHYTMSMWGPYNVFLMCTRLEWQARPGTGRLPADGRTADDAPARHWGAEGVLVGREGFESSTCD